MEMPSSITPLQLRVSLWRRGAAMLYDGLALIGVWFVAGAIAVAVNRGQAIPAGQPMFTAWLGFAAFAYLGYSWRRGRTLGMQSWRLRLIDAHDGSAPKWRQSVLRFLIAGVSLGAAGCGFWAALLDPEGATWHDRLSGTRLVRDYRPRRTRL